MVLVFVTTAFLLGVLVGAVVMRLLTQRLIQAQARLIAQLKREIARLNRSDGH